MTFKRIADIFISFIGLIILSPLFLIIAILIKIESPGPVFFRQLRVGKDEINFYIFKFRTMKANSENNGPKITVKDDKRITLVGNYLRKYKLDEFPQLINVFSSKPSNSKVLTNSPTHQSASIITSPRGPIPEAPTNLGLGVLGT